jgi:hypothetical protein
MKLDFLDRFFEKSSNIKCRENMSYGSRVVACGRTDTTKLIVAVRNFANAPKQTCLHELLGSLCRTTRRFFQTFH